MSRATTEMSIRFKFIVKCWIEFISRWCPIMRSSLNLFFFSSLLSFHQWQSNWKRYDCGVWTGQVKNRTRKAMLSRFRFCKKSQMSDEWMPKTIPIPNNIKRKEEQRENSKRFECSWKFIAIVWLLWMKQWINLLWTVNVLHWILISKSKVKSSEIFHGLIHFH